MKARVRAWGVHLFTALGLVAAAAMAARIVAEDYETAFALMVVATLIDALDGTLARAAQVSKVLPGFDGRRLDDIIDFQTYTSLPLLLMWRAHVVDGPWLLFPLLASAYGFCQSNIKTEDGYFLGFPSYWNIVAFYLYHLHVGQWGIVVVVVLALLTFVPTRYLYPSQPGTLNRITIALAVPWVAMILAGWIVPSLYFPVFYMAASFWVSAQGVPGRSN